MSALFDRYAEFEYTLAALQLAFAMLGMGALLTPRDFAEVFRRPRSLSLGLACQWLAVPLLAVAVSRILPVEAGIATGLILVAAAPGGTMSNLLTYFGRGNIALSIALTAVCTLAALVTTPAVLRLLAGEFLPDDFEMPVVRVAREIFVNLLLPLAAGMAIGTRFERQKQRFATLCIRASLLSILLMAVGAGGSGRLDPQAYGWSAPAAIGALALAAQAFAVLSARALGLAGPDRNAIVIEVTVRNTNLALLIKASLFPAVAGRLDPIGDGMFFVALLYGGVALFFALPPLLLNRWATPAPDEAPPA